jgi:hypothetical protein
MRPATGILLACALAWALAGCGTSAKDQVRAKVEQLGTATAHQDYKTICDEVLAPQLLARLASTHLTCVQAIQIALGSVQNPTLSIGRIDVTGKTASAITLTTARNEQASVDAIDLIDTPHGWRVSSLGSPTQTSPSK